jgi:hypothetical protein
VSQDISEEAQSRRTHKRRRKEVEKKGKRRKEEKEKEKKEKEKEMRKREGKERSTAVGKKISLKIFSQPGRTPTQNQQTMVDRFFLTRTNNPYVCLDSFSHPPRLFNSDRDSVYSH